MPNCLAEEARPNWVLDPAHSLLIAILGIKSSLWGSGVQALFARLHQNRGFRILSGCPGPRCLRAGHNPDIWMRS